MEFPEELTATSLQNRRGDLAWPQESLLAVIRWLEQHELAILGGDVWVLDADGRVSDSNPETGEFRGGWVWSVGDRRENENWLDYVRRCAEYAQQWIEEVDPASEIAVLPGERLIFEPSWVTEEEYVALGSRDE